MSPGQQYYHLQPFAEDSLPTPKSESPHEPSHLSLNPAFQTSSSTSPHLSTRTTATIGAQARGGGGGGSETAGYPGASGSSRSGAQKRRIEQMDSQSPDLLGKNEEDGGSEDDAEDGGEDGDGDGDGDGGTGTGAEGGGVPKKKHRVTLPRGRACVACRTRKLRCTGDQPCSLCRKNGVECRYEEIQKRKPRAVLMEERVAQLEALLLSKGETLPPTQLKRKIPLPPMKSSPSTDKDSMTEDKHTPVSVSVPTEMYPLKSEPLGSSSSNTVSPTMPVGNKPPGVSNSAGPSRIYTYTGTTTVEVPPHSPLEDTLINIILPHTPYLLLPLHPERFLALMSLPADDPSRPHPALLYILFAEAVRVLETGTPIKQLPTPPRSLFPSPGPYPFSRSVQHSSPEDVWVLDYLGGASDALLERARTELDRGLRNVDRLFDLVRASVGITRFLISLGRFMEGYSMPISRLVVACGLHRQTGVIVPPDGLPLSPEQLENPMPKPFASPYHYRHANSSAGSEGPGGFPILRMRPVVLPPPRDEIELSERVMTFWAAKYQEWEMSTGWGWSISLADEECTTMWPWGWGTPEIRPPAFGATHYTIHDLFLPHSGMQTTPYPDTTFTLAMKSMALLHRASHLFDLPITSVPEKHTRRPNHIPPLADVEAVVMALQMFRDRIPLSFQDIPHPAPIPQPPRSQHSYSRTQDSISPGPGNTPGDRYAGYGDYDRYDGPGDPWWIMLHANLLLAELMTYKELAHHQRNAYEQAVRCARAMVSLVKRLRPESYVHLPLIISLDFSLAARFLNKESSRLNAAGHTGPALDAAQEADVLRAALANDMSRWVPMASLQAMIIQRVKEGFPEKEGEYERV